MTVPEMPETPDNHLEVFYIDRVTGWAVAEFDAERNQQGEAQFSYHKADAVRGAHDLSQGQKAIHIYGKNGERQADAKTFAPIKGQPND